MTPLRCLKMKMVVKNFSLHKTLHFSLRLTFEKELNSSLPFLDVLLEKHETRFIPSMYKNPPLSANTYTGILLAL